MRLYQQMGVSDCIASDAQSYVQLALRLAGDPAWRREVSQKITDAHPCLFEDLATVRELEDFLVGALSAAPRSS